MKYIKLTLLLFICLSTRLVYADIDMERLAMIESSNNPNAVSYRGAKYGRGLYQVSEICLYEYNEMTGNDYQPKDLFNPHINTLVAVWYLDKRIPQMLKHYGLDVTDSNILWAYNAGIGRVLDGVMPDETRRYIKKYKLLTKEEK